MIYKYSALLFCALALTAAFACSAHCLENSIEFRPVLSEGELQGKTFDLINSGGDSLYVWKLHYLSDHDLDRIDVTQSATKANIFMVVIKFNEDGKKRLYRFTKKFAKRRVAIFVEGKLVTAPVVWIPYFMGDKVVIKWPGSQKDLWAFANKVNSANPGIISLFIEEQGSYNDYAADEWARYYTELNNYIEQRRKRFASDVSITESERDF